ncbi:MAG: GNAT family N-acetyltransferase [Tannerellaceae bacterium]|jgi:ribosomal protein S18 acetylase RimI-like enzyme|nr:GNAT family N-acetyltransferase [Tannerellaceae bacterium]
MEVIRIRSGKDSFFPAFWEIYEQAFPLCERRDLGEQVRVLGDEAYALEAWTGDGGVIGFIGWWDCGDLRYVEHYAIHPSCRSHGYGSRFLKEWISQSALPVLLEIEPVTDGLTLGRQRFYHKSGFVDNTVRHLQPPYHEGDAPLELWLMSYPDTVPADAYERFYSKLKMEIMPQF